MTPRILTVIVASVALSALAQLMLKIGVGHAQRTSAAPTAELASFMTSPLVLAGLATYGLGAVLWLFVLSRTPLSVAYPFVGMGFVITMLTGILILGEAASAAKLVGTLLIACGCVLVGRAA